MFSLTFWKTYQHVCTFSFRLSQPSSGSAAEWRAGVRRLDIGLLRLSSCARTKGWGGVVFRPPGVLSFSAPPFVVFLSKRRSLEPPVANAATPRVLDRTSRLVARRLTCLPRYVPTSGNLARFVHPRTARGWNGIWELRRQSRHGSPMRTLRMLLPSGCLCAMTAAIYNLC